MTIQPVNNHPQLTNQKRQGSTGIAGTALAGGVFGAGIGALSKKKIDAHDAVQMKADKFESKIKNPAEEQKKIISEIKDEIKNYGNAEKKAKKAAEKFLGDEDKISVEGYLKKTFDGQIASKDELSKEIKTVNEELKNWTNQDCGSGCKAHKVAGSEEKLIDRLNKLEASHDVIKKAKDGQISKETIKEFQKEIISMDTLKSINKKISLLGDALPKVSSLGRIGTGALLGTLIAGTYKAFTRDK